MKRLLIITTALCVFPVGANAAPITAFFISLGAGAAFAGVLTNIVVSVALSVIATALTPKPKAQGISGAATIADAQVNTRFETATRWQAGGRAALGGAAGTFGEYDDDGNFWYFIVHADAELTDDPVYLLDDIPVTVSDGSGGHVAGDVLTDEFCLTTDGAQYEGSGTRVPTFRLYTVTPSVGNVYGAQPAAFTSAFPDLPTDFYLAGLCYTIVRCRAVDPAYRNTAMHWRGPFGLGEPSVVLVGNWSRMYDPRNEAHDIDDPDTWTSSNGNPAIVWAWFRTTAYGRNRPMTEINWTKVGEQADICDLTVLDRDAVATPLYRCGVAFPDNKPRWECERDILETADAFVAYDDEGLAYPVVGYYVAPSLTFTADRDILSAETEITDDGETAVDGVVIYYTDPDLNYTRQPCAPWVNPAWYDGAAVPNYYTEEILGCQNHNQAVRLAKAVGLRIAAERRASFGTTIKGILAKRERGIMLDYDAEFQGAYEIVSPVEQDTSGVACSFAVVPLPADKWTLNDGEEGIPPQATPALGLTDPLDAASGVSLSSDGLQIKATFDAPARADRVFEFRYRLDGTSDGYQFFAVNMADLVAYSAVATNGADYDVQWRTVTGTGRATAWSATTTITVTANPTAPDALSAASATGGAGQATVDFTTANDPNQFAVAIYRGATNVFGSATLIGTVYVGPNVATDSTETGLAAGTWYYWAEPRNNSAVAGTASGPFTVTVT